jgi:glycosyltransferase involved in cell wall biosynthesis
LALARFNLKLNEEALEEDRKLQEAEYERLSKIHNFDEFDTELPICLLVPGYNNNDKFRLENSLNSIFSQNYTNYFVVILDDASIDKSNEVYSNYLNFYDINPHRYVYIKNQKRLTPLESIYYSGHNICSEDSILMIVDGDDELIGKNALKLFNIAFQKNKAGVVYSNFYFYNQETGVVNLGFTSPYTD